MKVHLRLNSKKDAKEAKGEKRFNMVGYAKRVGITMARALISRMIEQDPNYQNFKNLEEVKRKSLGFDVRD